jgi:hypothetical protein
MDANIFDWVETTPTIASSNVPKRGNVGKKNKTTNKTKEKKLKGTIVDLTKAGPSDVSWPFDPDRHLMVVPVCGTYQGMLKLYCESALMTAPYDNYVAVYLDQNNKQYPVRWVDFRRYKQNLFISDELVNGFFWMMGNKFKEHKLRFGNSSLWSTYLSPDHVDVEQVKRILGNLLLADDKGAFVPVHVNGNHWLLVYILVIDKVIHVYDSLDITNTLLELRFVRYLSLVFGADVKWKTKSHHRDLRVQRQKDSTSCGFLTCWYAYQLATGGSVDVWEEGEWDSKIANIKESVMLSLLRRSISDDLFTRVNL